MFTCPLLSFLWYLFLALSTPLALWRLSGSFPVAYLVAQSSVRLWELVVASGSMWIWSEHLGSFQFAAVFWVKLHERLSARMFSFLLGKYFRAEFPHRKVSCLFTFLRSCQPVLWLMTPVPVPAAVCGSVSCWPGTQRSVVAVRALWPREPCGAGAGAPRGLY